VLLSDQKWVVWTKTLVPRCIEHFVVDDEIGFLLDMSQICNSAAVQEELQVGDDAGTQQSLLYAANGFDPKQTQSGNA
jgi:hypothetical protein